MPRRRAERRRDMFDLRVAVFLAVVEPLVALDLLGALDQSIERPGMAMVMNGPLGAGLSHRSVDRKAVIGILV